MPFFSCVVYFGLPNYASISRASKKSKICFVLMLFICKMYLQRMNKEHQRRMSFIVPTNCRWITMKFCMKIVKQFPDA